MSRRSLHLAAATVLALALAFSVAACGSSSNGNKASTVNPNGPEVSPAGDIPDNQAYVAYRPAGTSYSVKVPEGWARTNSGSTTSFTDKLNRIQMASTTASSAPTVAQAQKASARLTNVKVSTVSRSAGKAIRITYLTRSAPDTVTGKTQTDAVERYVFFHKGKRITLTLSGPKGADNVDPWKIVTESLRYTR
jgi:hypothetical protein